MPTIWEIIQDFKNSCKQLNWRTSETEDWIAVNENYHSFLWVKDISLSSFKRITSKAKCTVRDGFSYHIIDAAYTAWIFSSTPSKTLIKEFLEHPDFPRKTAIYDLSPLKEGKKLCLKSNRTDSPIFHEFESFLRNKLKIKFQPLASASNLDLNCDECGIVGTT